MVDQTLGSSTGNLETIQGASRRFQSAMLSFLLVTTLGTGFAVWRGTQVLQALRNAQFEFAPLLASDQTTAYPPFVEAMIASWPARLAVYEPGLDAGIRTVAAAGVGFLLFLLPRMRNAPKGIDLEAGENPGPRRLERLSRAKACAHYQGAVYGRTDGQPAAVSHRGRIFLPIELWQYLDRRFDQGSTERVAFVLVHEQAHSRSFDNALWSLGTINALLVIGFVGAIVGQLSTYAAMILLPDSLVHVTSYASSTGLAYALAALAMATVGAAVSGVVTNLVAAREYFADATAAIVVGAEPLPYVDAAVPAKVGTVVEPWRLGAAPPDRRLHVRGAFPRGGALAVSAVALWALVRFCLLFASGFAYSPGTALFDVAALGALGLLLSALPPRVDAARHYSGLPLILAVVVICFLASIPTAIDGFASRFGVSALFGNARSLGLLLPPVTVLACAALASRLRRPPPDPGWGEIDRQPARWNTPVPLEFAIGAPAWAVSFLIGGLCLFTVGGIVADVVLGIQLPRELMVFEAVSVAICLPMGLLVAKNLKRPSILSAVTELCLSFIIAAATYFMIAVMYDLAAGSQGNGIGALNNETILARVLSFDRSDLPSPSLSFGFCMVLSMCWIARFRFKRWQMGDT